MEYRVELVFPFENGLYPLTAMQHDPSQASVLGFLLADARFRGRTWRVIATFHGVAATPPVLFNVSYQLGECILKGTVKPLHLQTVKQRMKREDYARCDPPWSWAQNLAREER